MAVRKETVLYYTPEAGDKARLLKGVLVRMGIRIKNIAPEQVTEKVGYLAGIEGYEGQSSEEIRELPVIPQEVLVLKDFGDRRLEELLKELRRAKVPPIPLKAVVTEINADWSFYKLYQEIRAEHEQMTADRK